MRGRRNLDSLPIHAQELDSDDLNTQIEAATYFRKVLAIGKTLLRYTLFLTDAVEKDDRKSQYQEE
jgi:hypothetical protein